jgi:cell division protein FtsB
MKIIALLASLGLAAFIASQLYRLNVQRSELQEKADKISAKVEALQRENEKLAVDIEYFSRSENLLKELKELFNYRKPGEKLIIIVPKKSEKPAP